jgi:hypothetical protein
MMALRFHSSVGDLCPITGETGCVPASFQQFGILRSGGILREGKAGKILLQKAQAERDFAGHAEAPAEIARSVFSDVVVQAGIAAAAREKDARHKSLLKTNGTRPDPDGKTLAHIGASNGKFAAATRGFDKAERQY